MLNFFLIFQYIHIKKILLKPYEGFHMCIVLELISFHSDKDC